MNNSLFHYKKIIRFMFIYWVICLIFLLLEGVSIYSTLIWNTFLAALPLFFIEQFLSKSQQSKKAMTIVYGVLWLLFFPNAVYIVTDLIHLSNETFLWEEMSGGHPVNSEIFYNKDIAVWLKLLVVGLGVLYGLFVGMESLNIAYRYIKQQFNAKKSRWILLGIALISGFGVYIGRFLRFNSWDILRPFSLVWDVLLQLNFFTIEFTIAFAGFILLLFSLYRFIRELPSRKLE